MTVHHDDALYWKNRALTAEDQLVELKAALREIAELRTRNDIKAKAGDYEKKAFPTFSTLSRFNVGQSTNQIF